MKRQLSIILCIFLILGAFSTAMATQGPSSRSSHVFHETTLSITFKNGNVYALGSARADGTAQKLGIRSLRLFEDTGTSWMCIASAFDDYGYGVSEHDCILSAPAVPGVEYKLVAVFYGELGSYTDTVSQNLTVLND